MNAKVQDALKISAQLAEKLRSRVAEVLVLTALILGMFVWKSVLIARLIIPNWDPAVYLLNRATYFLDYQCTSGSDPFYSQK